MISGGCVGRCDAGVQLYDTKKIAQLAYKVADDTASAWGAAGRLEVLTDVPDRRYNVQQCARKGACMPACPPQACMLPCLHAPMLACSHACMLLCLHVCTDPQLPHVARSACHRLAPPLLPAEPTTVNPPVDVCPQHCVYAQGDGLPWRTDICCCRISAPSAA